MELDVIPSSLPAGDIYTFHSEQSQPTNHSNVDEKQPIVLEAKQATQVLVTKQTTQVEAVQSEAKSQQVCKLPC